MRGPSERFLLDAVRVGPPAGGLDAERAPLPAIGPEGAELACSVQETTTSQATRREEQPLPLGVTRYEVRFATDPDIAAAGQKLRWTRHKGVDLAVPVVLAAEGPARPPKGLASCWAVSATRRK